MSETNLLNLTTHFYYLIYNINSNLYVNVHKTMNVIKHLWHFDTNLAYKAAVASKTVPVVHLLQKCYNILYPHYDNSAKMSHTAD